MADELTILLLVAGVSYDRARADAIVLDWFYSL